MKFGQTFKQIRKSKGMTLKEAAGESLSVAQVSRFENEQSMVTVDVLYEMLNHINTTPPEYYFLMGADPEKELREFFDRIVHINGNIQETKKLEEEKEKLLNQNPGPYDWERYMIYLVDNLIKVRNNEPLDTDHKVRDYLLQADNWGERELRIYALLGFVLPVDSTYFLMKTAVKRSENYLSIPQDMKLLHTILTNNFSTFVFYDRLDYAKETLDLFETALKQNSEFIESHLNFIFNKGVFAFTQGDFKAASKHCEEVLALCETLQLKERGKMYANRYKTWKEESDNPEFKEITIEPGILGLSLD